MPSFKNKTAVKSTPRPKLPTVKVTKEHIDIQKAFWASRSQAKYRNELFNLTFAEYQQLWHGLWEFRGRQPDELVMTRIEKQDAWCLENCEIITRRQQILRNSLTTCPYCHKKFRKNNK